MWSRRWMRSLLTDLLDLPPEVLPLDAPPGQPPKLAEGWGFVSLSHCPDALLLAWAPWRVGVDLERCDRVIPAESILKRFFCAEEQEHLSGLVPEALRQAVLAHWVLKESAIKWQRGSLGRDLTQWCWSRDRSVVIHRGDGAVLSASRWRQGPWCLAMVAGQGDVGNGANPMHTAMLCLA